MDKNDLLESVPHFWKFWNENGIETDKAISLLFTFYSAFDTESSNLVLELEQNGYRVEKKSKRTMIIFKGYVISAEKTKLWTQEELKHTLTELESLAIQHETALEGYFAAANS